MRGPDTAVFCLSLLMVLTRPAGTSAQQEPVRVTSPDGAVELVLTPRVGAATNPGPRYSVSYRGRPVITDAALGLEIDAQPPLERRLKPPGVKLGEGDETYRVPAGKSNPIRDRYRSARLDFVEEGGQERTFAIEARAYDDGVAFRYLIPEQPNLKDVRIARERTEFRFAKDATTYPLVVRNYATPYEDEYQQRWLSGLHPEWLIALPLLVDLPGVAWAAVAEANIENYAGMYLAHGQPRSCSTPAWRRTPVTRNWR